jgi:hypothetical protein
MSHKPILTPIVEIKIPQDVNYSGHVRRQTPEKLEAERKKGIYRTPYGSRAKMGRDSFSE